MRAPKLLAALLALALLSVPTAGMGQEAERKLVGESVQNAVVRLTRGENQPNYEAFTGLLIDEKGLVLTPWTRTCIPSTYKGMVRGSSWVKASFVGVHPNRNLALLQLELPGDFKGTPVAIASAAPGLGDSLYKCGGNSSEAVPCTVASETSPVDHPEYFWVSTTHFPYYRKQDNDGWGGSVPQPEDAVVNLRGQLAGVCTRTIVNGKMVVRFMPVSDVRPSDFIHPSKRAVNQGKVRELLQMADDEQNTRKKGVMARNYWTEVNASELLRMALGEDPENADVYARLGLVREAFRQTGGAVPMLAQSVQMEPWADSAANSYLELGNSIANDSRRKADAIAVWAEGAAKFPTKNPKLWEALAKGHFDTSNFLAAARETRMASATFGSQSKEMADIYDKSRQRLSDTDMRDLRNFESSLQEQLRRLTAEAETARKDRVDFMTGEGKRVILQESKGASSGSSAWGKKGGLADPTRGMSSEEVESVFVRSRVGLAMDHVRAGRLKEAKSILEDVIASYPKAPDTQTAKDLLKTISK